MNLLYGEVIDVLNEDGGLIGKIKVRGATKKIPLGLLTDVAQGDRVLICDGVAIGKIVEPQEREKKICVWRFPGNSLKSAPTPTACAWAKPTSAGS